MSKTKKVKYETCPGCAKPVEGEMLGHKTGIWHPDCFYKRPFLVHNDFRGHGVWANEKDWIKCNALMYFATSKQAYNHVKELENGTN